MRDDPPRTDYFCGLDLGQSGEFTSLAVLEKTSSFKVESSTYAVRHLERFPLGTAYVEVFERVHALFEEPPLSKAVLVVDVTAVGKPVLDLLQRSRPKARLVPVTITAGHKASGLGVGRMVPKKDLVGVLQVLLQGGRLKVSPSLPEAKTLVEELQTFRAKMPTEKEDSLDWRERPHDDLVLAVAVAAWIGERMRSWNPWLERPEVIETGSGWRQRK